MVVFFGMTNSPATFQGIMNEILRMAAFVDNVLVRTKTEM